MRRSARRTWAARALSVALVIGAAAPLGGCELLGGALTGEVPVVELSENQALLVDPPDLLALGKYLCAKALPFPASELCIALGPPPTKEELQFRLQLVFRIDNPNGFPVPTTELMVGLHVYPDQTFGELGAICVTFCEAGADNCPIPPEGACVHRAEDIDSVEEFIQAAVVGGIDLATDALGGQPIGERLGLYTVPSGGDLELKVTLAIGIDPMLKLLEHTAATYLYDLIENQSTKLDIPYAVAGRLWFDIPYLGRVTVGFGPFGDAEQPLYWPVL